MGDIKFYALADGSPREILGHNAAVERSLQRLIEGHLDVFFGMRFLATEYSTGVAHGGRIDTLALDENDSPVIIEYKRATNENVINQGLYYMNWLVDHKAEFEALTRTKLGTESADRVEWTAPRLVCIVGDYTKFDVAAIQEMNRTIDLIRYKMYANQHLILELVATTQSKRPSLPRQSTASVQSLAASEDSHRDTSYSVEDAPKELRDLYDALRDFLLALGDDVREESTGHYIAFRRIKNFAQVKMQSNRIRIGVNVDPNSITLEDGFTHAGPHQGSDRMRIFLHSTDDLRKAEPLLRRSYEAG